MLITILCTNTRLTIDGSSRNDIINASKPHPKKLKKYKLLIHIPYKMITLRTQDPEGDFNRKDTRFGTTRITLPHIIFKTKGQMERIRKRETPDNLSNSQGIPAINYFQTKKPNVYKQYQQTKINKKTINKITFFKV